jgi:NADH dehydrogenase [ubiquinone] 1 alpha subcomplex assembly factor 7
VNDLGQRIARLIEAQGPLSVAQFMTMALHDPKAGYYATRDPFGSGGDFITAPEVSQMFGELLGLWIVQCWIDQGKPRARLMELGPGRGTLMSDALRAARLVPEFLSSIEVVMVEASPTLTAIQKETLKDTPCPIRWTERFEDRQDGRPLFLLANEFFDALPIHQFVRTERGWCERMVVSVGDKLEFTLAPDALNITPPNGVAAPMGALYETSPAATALAQQIGETIAHHGGAALIVDYGYDADRGFGETLQAVGDHKFAGLLDSPGEADLSAHLDFAALANAAQAGGAKIFGTVKQRELLISLGIVQRAERLSHNRISEFQDQLDRLLKPDQMGILFKALAIMPPNAISPPGF